MAGWHDGRPRHQQIAADLRARIMSGDLVSGEQLPSTSQLVEHYGAANTTIQRALTALKDEGFIRSEVGKGVYVRERQPLVVKVADYIPVTTGGYSYRLLSVAEIDPPASAATVFGAESRVILRHRMMFYAGEPVELSWSYYPAAIAAGTALAARGKIPGGAPRVLAELGYPPRRFVDRVSARAPTTEETEALELPVDVPVMRQFRVIYSDDARPIQVDVLIKGAHLYEVEYPVTVPQD